jgi:glycosyltransferase involved in cell wall biosynthesis
MSERVLHVINGEYYSGAERVQDLLALRLGEFGYEVSFACLKKGLFTKHCLSCRGRVISLQMRSKLDLLQGPRLAKQVRQGGFRVIHTHTPRSALVGRIAAALTGVPMVHHIHSPTSRCTSSAFRNRLNDAVEMRSAAGARKIIAVSESLGDYLRERGVEEEKIAVVPNGVPTPGGLPVRDLPFGKWNIGTVALFRPRKGMEVLLEALALLKEGGASFRLLAVGGFESERYEENLRALTTRMDLAGEVEWSGFSSDVSKKMAGMDLFVLPSLAGEGTPMVILEAMAAGVPVVATRVEGVPDVIRDGEEGLLATPGDPQALAAALSRVINGEVQWSSMREKAYHRQVERYSDVRMAGDVAAVYESILA